MSSREEVKMWEEAARLPLEMQPADAAAQSRAIRAGIVRGQKKSRKRLLAGSAGGLFAAAALAAGLLLFNPAEWFQPPVAAVEEKVEWGTLELFKDNLFYDPAVLPYVLKHDYIQSIDQSAESKGFTINVNAVFADENVLTMLYTASTTTDYEIYNVSSSRLKDLSTGGDIGDGNRSGNSSHVKENKQLYIGQTTLPLNRAEPAPDQVEAEFQIAYIDPGKLADRKTGTIMKDMHYTQKMKLSFAIDPKFWATPTEIVPVNQSFVIDGEKVTLTEIERSPVQTLTRFKFSDEVNADWERKSNILSDLLFNLSYIRGGVKTKLVPHQGNGTDDGYENMFEGNSLDRVDALLLELIRSEPKQEIRVDLNQK